MNMRDNSSMNKSTSDIYLLNIPTSNNNAFPHTPSFIHLHYFISMGLTFPFGDYNICNYLIGNNNKNKCRCGN